MTGAFCENDYQLKVVNYFRKKAPAILNIERILNRPLGKLTRNNDNVSACIGNDTNIYENKNEPLGLVLKSKLF